MEGHTSHKFGFQPPPTLHSLSCSSDIRINSTLICPGDEAVCRTVASQSTAKDEKNNALKVLVALEELGSAMGPGG